MADLNYTDLGLKKDTSIKIFKFQGKDIEVKKYLSIDDKYDTIMITLQKSYENGIYNPIKLDMCFHLNLVYIYTNLIFSDEDREDESKLYDEMKSSGFMDKFLNEIDPEEYAEMQEIIDELIDAYLHYGNSIAGVIRKVIDDLPANAEAAQKIIDDFDPNKYQAVIDFAKAANGGRMIT